MKPRTLLILAVALAAAAGLAWWKLGKFSGTFSDSVAPGKKVFPDFVHDEVNTLIVNDGTREISVVRKDGKWVLPSREGFPVKDAAVRGVLDNLSALQVSAVPKIGVSQLGRIKLKAPADKAPPEETGWLISTLKADGSNFATVVIGKTPAAAGPDMGTSQGEGQYIRTGDTIYQVRKGFTAVDTGVVGWFDTSSFFSITPEEIGAPDIGVPANAIKSVAVTGADPESTWKVLRDTADSSAVLKLDAPGAGEEFDSSKASALTSMFGATSLFSDVAPEADREKSGVDKPTRSAVIETFDGFTYTLRIGNAVTEPVDGYYLAYTPELKMAETRTPPAPKEDGKPAESEEEKKTRDQQYADQYKKRKEKLERESQLKNRIFIVQKSTVEALLKKRSELMKDKTPPAADGTAPPPPSFPSLPTNPGPPVPPPTPKTGATAVTPTIEVRPDGTTRIVKEGEMIPPDDKKSAETPPPAGEAKPAAPELEKKPDAPAPAPAPAPAAEETPAAPAPAAPAEPQQPQKVEPKAP